MKEPFTISGKLLKKSVLQKNVLPIPQNYSNEKCNNSSSNQAKIL
jgi:hypothetical protein